jgi:cell wall-associated NlpC family hydrolase
MSGGSEEGVRARVVEAAESALASESYRYAQVRPMASSLLDAEAYTTTDCSSFVTLCYKAAGARDPNGRDYDGTGYTGTLVEQGRWVDDPEPGDLVFYGEARTRPVHVALYVGDGKAISFGTDPMVKVPVSYRPDLLGYMQYDL